MALRFNTLATEQLAGRGFTILGVEVIFKSFTEKHIRLKSKLVILLSNFGLIRYG